MKISVLMPLLPVHPFWSEAIQSVVEAFSNTTYQCELLILCMDRNLRLPLSDSVRVIYSDPVPVSLARNILQKNAQGDYLTFIDDDDLFTHDRLQFLEFIDLDNFDMVVDDVVSFTNNDIKKNYVRSELLFTRKNKNIETMSLRQFFYNRVGFSRPILKRVFVEDIEHNENISSKEDLLYRAEIINKGPRVKVLNRPGYLYRIRKNSLSKIATDQKASKREVTKFIKQSGMHFLDKVIISTVFRLKFERHVEILSSPIYKLLQYIQKKPLPNSIVIHTYGLGDLVMAEDFIKSVEFTHGNCLLLLKQSFVQKYAERHYKNCRTVNSFFMFLIIMTFSNIIYITYIYPTIKAKLFFKFIGSEEKNMRSIRKDQVSPTLRSLASFLSNDENSLPKRLLWLNYEDSSFQEDHEIDQIYFHFGHGGKLDKSLTASEVKFIVDYYKRNFPRAEVYSIVGPGDTSYAVYDVLTRHEISFAHLGRYENSLVVCNDTGIGHILSRQGSQVDVIVTRRSKANLIQVLPMHLRKIGLLG